MAPVANGSRPFHEVCYYPSVERIRRPKHPGTEERRQTSTRAGSTNLKLANGHPVIFPRVRGSCSAQARARPLRLCGRHLELFRDPVEAAIVRMAAIILTCPNNSRKIYPNSEDTSSYPNTFSSSWRLLRARGKIR
jgi:hypothetical protein